MLTRFLGTNNWQGLSASYIFDDQLDFANNTLHLVNDQWSDIYKYYINKNVIPFINDINNIEYMLNNVKNNFFS